MKFNAIGYLATFFFAVFFAVGCKKDVVLDSVSNNTTSTSQSQARLTSTSNSTLKAPCTLNPNSGNILANLSQVANCGFGPIAIGDCATSNVFTTQSSSCLSSFLFKGDINLTPITLEQMNQIIAAARAFGASNSPSPCHQLVGYQFLTEFNLGFSCIKVKATYICCGNPPG
jgi:hypothetical protein